MMARFFRNLLMAVMVAQLSALLVTANGTYAVQFEGFFSLII